MAYERSGLNSSRRAMDVARRRQARRVFVFASMQKSKHTKNKENPKIKTLSWQYHKGQGKEKGGRMESGERSAHNVTLVLTERPSASSAQTRATGARREAGIGTESNGTRMSLVCFSSPSPPASQAPVPDADPMFRWTGSLRPIT